MGFGLIPTFSVEVDFTCDYWEIWVRVWGFYLGVTNWRSWKLTLTHHAVRLVVSQALLGANVKQMAFYRRVMLYKISDNKKVFWASLNRKNKNI